MGERISLLLDLQLHEIMATMGETVAQMVDEGDAARRRALWGEYQEQEAVHRKYMNQAEAGREAFSWKWAFDTGDVSLYDLVHFKDCCLGEGVTEAEWQGAVEEEYQYMGKDKVDAYVAGHMGGKDEGH